MTKFYHDDMLFLKTDSGWITGDTYEPLTEQQAEQVEHALQALIFEIGGYNRRCY